MRVKRCKLVPQATAAFNFLSDVSFENDKEMGMLLCKKGKKLASGGVCIGESCSVTIPNKCPTGYEPYIQAHTHPKTVDIPSHSDFMNIAATRVPIMCVISPERRAYVCFENAGEFMERQKKKQAKEYSTKTFVNDWYQTLSYFKANPDYDIERMSDDLSRIDFSDELSASREQLFNDGMELLLDLAKEHDKEGLKVCIEEVERRGRTR